MAAATVVPLPLSEIDDEEYTARWMTNASDPWGNGFGTRANDAIEEQYRKNTVACDVNITLTTGERIVVDFKKMTVVHVDSGRAYNLERRLSERIYEPPMVPRKRLRHRRHNHHHPPTVSATHVFIVVMVTGVLLGLLANLFI
jgi:hypothetical protein